MIIAIDPGGTTGVAALEPPVTLLYSGQIHDRAKLLAWVRYHEPEVLVVEDFKPYEGLPAWADLPAPRLIGALEELGFQLIMQPSSIKKQFPDDLLKVAGMHKPGQPHANDAVRHALYYAWFKQRMRTAAEVQAIYRRYLETKRAERKRRYSQSPLPKLRQQH